MPGAGGISAKNAKIKANSSTVLEAAEWSVTDEAGEIDDTSFEDGGYGSLTTGIIQATVNVKAFWNPTSNQHTSPLNIFSGSVLTTNKFYLNDTTGKYWDFPRLVITSVNETAVVREGIRYEFTAKTDGTYTPPA